MAAAKKTGKATVVMSLPIVNGDHDRVIGELDAKDGGGWVVGRVSQADRDKFEQEFSLDIGALQAAALWGLAGDPKIGTAFNGQAGKALAAGVLILMLGIGLIKTTTEPQS